MWRALRARSSRGRRRAWPPRWGPPPPPPHPLGHPALPTVLKAPGCAQAPEIVLELAPEQRQTERGKTTPQPWLPSPTRPHREPPAQEPPDAFYTESEGLVASHGGPRGNPALRGAETASEQGALPSGSGWSPSKPPSPPPVQASAGGRLTFPPSPPIPRHAPPPGFPACLGLRSRQTFVLMLFLPLLPVSPSSFTSGSNLLPLPVLRHLPTLHPTSRSAAPRQGSGQGVGGRAGWEIMDFRVRGVC